MPTEGKAVAIQEPWVATDEDCETGFLVSAPEDISEAKALAMFVRLFEAEFGKVRAVDGEPLAAELRPYREPRTDEPHYAEAPLVACRRGEEPSEMVWVIEEIEWVVSEGES